MPALVVGWKHWTLVSMGCVLRYNLGLCCASSAGVPTEACRALFESFGNCVLEMLAEGVSSARLETRTKESNVYASWWAENPRSARNLTGAMFFGTAASTSLDLL